MSKLIKAMIKELLSNKGKEIDRTIMSNIKIITSRKIIISKNK